MSSNGMWIRPERRRLIYERDRWRCRHCGGKVTTHPGPRRATLDHDLPRSLGGTHCSDNLLTACLSCNSSRKDLLICIIVVDLADAPQCRSSPRARARRHRRAPGTGARARRG